MDRLINDLERVKSNEANRKVQLQKARDEVARLELQEAEPPEVPDISDVPEKKVSALPSFGIAKTQCMVECGEGTRE